MQAKELQLISLFFAEAYFLLIRLTGYPLLKANYGLDRIATRLGLGSVTFSINPVAAPIFFNVFFTKNFTVPNLNISMLIFLQ